jgi:hypothetical protein
VDALASTITAGSDARHTAPRSKINLIVCAVQTAKTMSNAKWISSHERFFFPAGMMELN